MGLGKAVVLAVQVVLAEVVQDNQLIMELPVEQILVVAVVVGDKRRLLDL